MASEAQKRAQAKYDAVHTVQIKLKLHKENDADILKRLEQAVEEDRVKGKQGYIKELIRADIKAKGEKNETD